MKKVLIIGSPGSGKSTFARKLHNITNLPIIHLDMLNWNSDKTTVSKTVFEKRIQAAISEKHNWIMDGNYLATMPMRLKKCDTIFFMDYSTETCLSGVQNRIGKKRPDMPWIEEEFDPEFKQYIKDFRKIRRPKILALLKDQNSKTIIIFHSREEANRYLEELRK